MTGAFDPSPADHLTVFYSRNDDKGADAIFQSARLSTSSDWGEGMPLPPPVDLSQYFDGYPNVYADGLQMIFHSNRPGGQGGDELWEATRVDLRSDWEVTNLASVNSPKVVAIPS